MPLYDFKCGSCGAKFEELIRGGSAKVISCPVCQSQQTARIPSVVNHQFGASTQGGNSGIDSIDSSLDQKVGRDATRRHKEIEKREHHKKAIREQTGASALQRKGDTYVPLSEKERQVQAKVAKGYNRGRQGLDGWNVVGDA